MSWDDRYFEAAPRGSRGFIAFAGVLMVLIGVLLALGGRVQLHRSDVSTLRAALVVIVGASLALYGLDLVIRAARGRHHAPLFAGVSGALRLAGATTGASLVLGTGVYGIVRGEVVVGSLVTAAGVAALCLLLFARARMSGVSSRRPSS